MPDKLRSFSSPTAVPETGMWPLDIVRNCFALLVAGPAPLAVNGAVLPGLPDRMLPLDELRDRLMAVRCLPATRDAAWAQVIRRSRAQGGAWTVGCAGMALPALAAVAARLSAHSPTDPADVHAEVLTGFLAALATARLDLPRIIVRLRWAAYRSGLAILTQSLDAPHPDPDLFAARTADTVASASPDQVLADAVTARVLSPTEADLIAATRLDAVPVRSWAARHAIPPRAAYTLRTHAEDRLLAYLTGATQAAGRRPPTAGSPTASIPPPPSRSRSVTTAAAGRPARRGSFPALVAVTACG